MNDFIIKLLNLKQEDLDFIDSVSRLNQANFLITLKVRNHVCPSALKLKRGKMTPLLI